MPIAPANVWRKSLEVIWILDCGHRARPVESFQDSKTTRAAYILTTGSHRTAWRLLVVFLPHKTTREGKAVLETYESLSLCRNETAIIRLTATLPLHRRLLKNSLSPYQHCKTLQRVLLQLLTAGLPIRTSVEATSPAKACKSTPSPVPTRLQKTA